MTDDDAGPASASGPLAALVGRSMHPWGRALLGALLLVTATARPSVDAPTSAVETEAVALRAAFAAEVMPRLEVPSPDRATETALLDAALAASGTAWPEPQLVIVIDRSPYVQAGFLFLGSPKTGWLVIGAAPVSTGLPGRFDHFETPLGVFEHTPANPDFRAEGTKNELGIRGYGRKGMRVYDFGWARSRKGWGDHALGTMRLQMHATDPDVLEQRLGTVQSKGCVRIPAALNEFIDRRGLIDGAYDEAAAGGARFWVLHADRTAAPYAGRWLVVIDSQRDARPAWSPWPAAVPVPHRR